MPTPIVYRTPIKLADVDPLALLTLPGAQTDRRYFWSSPDASVTLAGLGVANAVPMAAPDDLMRFAALGFDPGDPGDLATASADDLWRGFGAAACVLPATLLSVHGTNAELTLVRDDATQQVLAAEALKIQAHLTAAPRLSEALATGVTFASHTPAQPIELPPAEAHALRQRIARAIGAIRAGELDKVVVATSHTVDLNRPVAPVAVLACLRRLQPGCFHYLWQAESDRALVGASPERLVAVHGDRLDTMALAGSARRDPDPAIDAALGAALLASPKDRAEHAWVVEAIENALYDGIATSVDVPSSPRLRRLATIQHLETPISAHLPAQGDVLAIARRLQPTPALGGTPRARALDLIQQLEDDGRGWYGGAMGWVDGHGNGDLAVVIRCVLLDGRQATAFAGAGIVADSDPEAEVREIELKLSAAMMAVRIAQRSM